MTQYFKRVADAKDRLLAELAELDMTHGDVHVVIPAVSQWMPVPGIEHVSVFHVPNPNGDGELYMNVVRMQPGASAENVKFAESTTTTNTAGTTTPASPGTYSPTRRTRSSPPTAA